MQTKDDGKHAILPVAVHPDHAGMPVTLPRESDGNMRRDGSDVVWLLQPSDEKSAVDERGRVHGAPELSPVKELLAAEKFRVDYRARSERRRCRSSRPKCPRMAVVMHAMWRDGAVYVGDLTAREAGVAARAAVKNRKLLGAHA